MSIKKNFSKLICLLALALSLSVVVSATRARSEATVPPAVGTYLASIQNNDWVVMAQGALKGTPGAINFLKTLDGSTANDYSTYILALTSIGKDPRYFGSENLVNGLRQKASDGQLGDSALINDDMFGLIALVSAGVPVSDALVQSEAAYLKSKQLPDGSWDFTQSSAAGSVDMTAMGIMALRASGIGAGDPVLTKAVGFLANSQKDDGGWPLLPGGNSNTESTAWVLSALYALGDNPDFWAPLDASPVDYLLDQIQSDGHAGFDATLKSTTGRTPVTTAYAAIALAGKYYPIKILSTPVAANIRLEGQTATVCEAQVEGRAALDTVPAAASICGFTYRIKDTQYGPYLDKINNDEAAGQIGWSFLVNEQLLPVGAADYQIKAGDNILLYYGNWNDLPLRVIANSANVAVGGETVLTVEKYDYNEQKWLPAPATTIKRASESWNTNGAGQATLSWPQAGSFEIWAIGPNLVRSPRLIITVGAGGGQQKSLGLAVEVTSPLPLPAAPNVSAPTGPAIVFGVSGDLNFGKLTAGGSANKTATLTNSGTANINTTASVSGAEVFKKNLTLDSQAVLAWQKRLNAGSQAPVDVTLSIPANYTGSGEEQGSLIFWANVAP